MPDDKPVERVGDYEFLDRLAVGGMGEVWRVRHVTLGAVYIAKRLRMEYREDPEFLKRFFHEAKLVANLRHPNIVQVFGYDEKNQLILMEYVEGMDLDGLLRSKWELEFKEKRVIAEVVSDTIGYAHREHNLIHRDIKPSNVLIAMSKPGMPIVASRIKLTDFGIARVMSIDQRMTMSSGMVMGTVHYMAPEQFEGMADKPSDVYSIGILYYRLLTGHVPFDGPTAFVIRDKHMKDIPPAPHEVNHQVPVEDSLIVMKCMEKDPRRRFRDSAELYQALIARTTEPTVGALVDLHAATQVLPGPAPQEGLDVTHPTHLVERTARMPAGVSDATDATLMPKPSGATERTIPAARAAAPVYERPGAPARPYAPPEEGLTERTLRAPREGRPGEPKPRKPAPRKRRRLLVGAVLGLAVLAVVGVLLLRPRYEIRWNTLRPDPLDTPSGIQVSVSPRIAMGLIWLQAGTVTDTAPPNWSNWTTAFGAVDVKLSDGLFREYVVTVRPAEGTSVVDFDGATFEQLAKAHGVEIQEDLSRVGDYLNAILVPKNVKDAHCLADLRRSLDRAAELLAKAKDVSLEGTPANSYHGALENLLLAADALADSKRDEAETAFRKAETFIRQIDPGELGQLPDDFLFRQTLKKAVTQLTERAEKADRLIKGLEPLADSVENIRYTVDRYQQADRAVADHLFFAPGRTAFGKILEKPAEARPDLEKEVADLGESVPPPIAAARRYLAKLDTLLSLTPSKGLEGRLRAAALDLTDQLLTVSSGTERGAWLERCFGKEQLGFVELAQAFWQQAHQSRFQAAAATCRKLAAERMAAAATLLAGDDRLAEAEPMLQDAQECLETLLKTAHTPDEEKAAARGTLSTCCVQRALALFRRGAQSPAEEDEHLVAVRKLLDRGLDELSGGDPKTVEDGQALRHILRIQAEPLAKLAACRRANFAQAGVAQGQAQTLFDALAAYESVLQQTSGRAGSQATRAALAPFAHLQAEACQGFTLPNAAAWWLLTQADESAQKARYRGAATSLDQFALTPGQRGAPAESPLKRLLPPEIGSKAEKLAAIAKAFDETSVPAEAVAMTERWKKLWETRLKAKPMLDLDIPATVAPGTLPQQYRGQEEQWTAILARMKSLLDHYRGRLAAEEALRKVEELAKALRTRPPGTANPEEALAALQPLKAGGALPPAEDQVARVAELERLLNSLRGQVVDVAQRVAELLAKPDPKAALDELKARGATVDAALVLRLTRQAVAAWVKQAQGELEKGNLDAAIDSLRAIRLHEQVQKHAADAEVAAAFAESDKAVSYAEGVQSLTQGARGFAAALASFQKVAGYRDAEALARQLQTLQDATKHKDTAPFQAIGQLKGMTQDAALNPKLRQAAEAVVKEVQTAITASAAACVQKFNEEMAKGTKGAWERYLDTRALLPTELKRLRTFLALAEQLDIKPAKEPPRTEVFPGNSQLKLTGKRVLTFHYKLPDGGTLPMEFAQTIEWTVRCVPPDELEHDERWLITNWTEAP